MDYLAAFDISASGMAVEKARLDAISLNLANKNTTRGVNGDVYKPVRVISAVKTNEFDSYLNSAGQIPQGIPQGVEIVDVQEMNVDPKLVFEPGHPDADEKGFVAYPNIDSVSEMLHLIEATRSYEANVRALNAAKTMAQRALEIGRQK